jgi:hypothetical protein
MRCLTKPRLGRHLACVLGAGLLALVPAASAQAPPAPTAAQAFTIAGDIAAGWLGALNATNVDLVDCDARSSGVRRCFIHVYGLNDDEDFFDCHWWINVRLTPDGRVAWRTIRKRSEDTDCPSPLPLGPATTGVDSIPPTGRLSPPVT